jgi:hypothetical protein
MTKRRLVLSAIATAFAASCASPGSVDQLEFRDIVTGYVDEGIVDGQNKLVPSITFKLHNKSGEPVSSVQFNVQFLRAGDDGPKDEVLTRVIDASGLAAQQATAPIHVRAKVGYTGQQARAEMLQHRDFVDMRARIFGKAGSAQWAQIGEFPIDRKLITR